MDQDMLIGFATIAALLAVILVGRRPRRGGGRSYGHGAESSFVFGADGDASSSSCDSGDSGGGGDCGGGGGD